MKSVGSLVIGVLVAILILWLLVKLVIITLVIAWKLAEIGIVVALAAIIFLSVRRMIEGRR